MRLGVLDVGSNTVHLVVDAQRGGHPTPTMPAAHLAEMAGAGPRRAHRPAAGALVAEAAMRALGVTEFEICPWAPREGVILRRLDTLDGTSRSDRSAHDPPGGLGRLTSYEARCTG